eukprot:9504284-Lingulodinium_polyedra.AAC.1
MIAVARVQYTPNRAQASMDCLQTEAATQSCTLAKWWTVHLRAAQADRIKGKVIDLHFKSESARAKDYT